MVQNKKNPYYLVLIIVAMFLSSSLYAQKSKKYFIYFKDKANSTYSIKKPDEFLSKKSIERRKNQDIKIIERDLPVNANYIQELKNTGVEFWYASKWMNGAMILADEAGFEKVKSLSFVKSTLTLTENTNVNKKVVEFTKPSMGTKVEILIETQKDYGISLNQIQQLGADDMHKQGYKGKGMTIAVFDAGFQNADKIDIFKHIFAGGRMLGTYNFVDCNEYVYGTGDHGTKVLSTIAAYDKGKMIGTAPEAQFYLFRTEDASSEYKVEEVNWLIAAERADSLGVDVINSSLGYTDFDDKSMNYTYKDMNGKNAFITQAADFAAYTGMLVVTSAGNEGGDQWQYVSAPADADSVLTVGAVDGDGKYAYFSSTGNTADKRLKPNVSAKGMGTTVGSPSGGITTSSGTSFSSPLMCGFAASFWQANPKLTNMQVIEHLQLSGSQASKPDSLLGYGIPNFKRVQESIQGKKKSKTGFNLYPNPIDSIDYLKVYLGEEYQGQDIEIWLYDDLGKLVTTKEVKNVSAIEYQIDGTQSLKSGIYILRVASSANSYSARIVKL